MERGGGEYAVLLRERNWLRQRCDEAVAKVNDLLELLSRAGQRLTQVEVTNAELLAYKETPQKLDWRMAGSHIDDINLGSGRRDEAILKDLVLHFDAVTSAAKDKTAQCDSIRQKLSEVNSRLQKAELSIIDFQAMVEELQAAKGRCEQDLALVREIQQRDTNRAEELLRKVEPLERDRTALMEQVLDLKTEMARALSHTKPFFVGLGKLRSVPIYLRYSGRLPNLNIDKGALEKFIGDVWLMRQQEWCLNAATLQARDAGGSISMPSAPKKQRSQANSARMIMACARRDPNFSQSARMDFSNVPIGVTCQRSFPEFLHHFISDKHRANPGETAYSVMDACARFKYDADVELFHRILTGDLPEDAYYDQTVVIEKFRMALYEQDVRSSDGGVEYDWTQDIDLALTGVLKPRLGADPDQKVSGKLSVTAVLDALPRFFPAKTSASRDALRVALCDDAGLRHTLQQADADEAAELLNVTEVAYLDLFVSDAKGNQGSFIEALRDQYVEELMMHTTEVLQCIQAAEGQMCGDGLVLLRMLKFQVLIIDEKPDRDIDRWLWLLTRDSRAVCPEHSQLVSSLSWDEPYELTRLNDRARKLLCKRSGPRPPDARARAFDLVEMLNVPERYADMIMAEAGRHSVAPVSGDCVSDDDSDSESSASQHVTSPMLSEPDP
eukprot:TRINITY_DN14872_c0_g1_i1.p1 TRINITY_DN14872_c0_g1~~TRINITY_DN14872_c0_g1_i1.p1  ORF type:complete len:670 (+),score=167.25 TRINITY_DN14872_c0_g1_i1:894-2903(+)